MKAKLSLRTATLLATLVGAPLVAACSGESMRREGLASGSAGAPGVAGASSIYWKPGTVDEFSRCPAELDYFIDVTEDFAGAGQLNEHLLTSACADNAGVAKVPIYTEPLGLERSDDRLAAFVGCNGDERVEVWRLPQLPPGTETAGFYTSADGKTYSTCGTSRTTSDTQACSPLGTLNLSVRSGAPSVLEGQYEMTLFDESGTTFRASGGFRVCSID